MSCDTQFYRIEIGLTDFRAHVKSFAARTFASFDSVKSSEVNCCDTVTFCPHVTFGPKLDFPREVTILDSVVPFLNRIWLDTGKWHNSADPNILVAARQHHDKSLFDHFWLDLMAEIAHHCRSIARVEVNQLCLASFSTPWFISVGFEIGT